MIHIGSTSTVVVSGNDKVNRSGNDKVNRSDNVSDNDRYANVLDTAHIVDV